MNKPNPMVPLLWGFVAILVPVGCLFLLLFSLLQPTKHQNLGMAAYQPPVGTRVEPKPPSMEATEYSDLVAHHAAVFAAGFNKPEEEAKPVAVAAPVAPKREVHRER